jgi:phage terminase large subunit-like protein
MILFPKGAKIYLEGADTPDTGRGYNAAGILCDELAKWLKPYETWYHGLLPSLRADLVDDHPRAFVTTTPKPIALLEDWVARVDGTVHLITGSTFDNASNLSSHALTEMKRQYDGTAIGEQELYGKLLELAGGGLFQRKDIIKNRVVDAPDDIVSIVVGCDPNLTGEDATFGIVVVARTRDKHLYVLADRSTPHSGRAAVLEAWKAVAEFAADVLVYEENLGKRYLEEVLRDAYRELIDQDYFPRHTSPPMQAVHAKHGKKTRAEPVAMRNEQGRLHMVGDWPELEKEMVLFDPESTRESPDRMDAMVHAAIKLMAGERREMRVANPNIYEFRMDQSFYDLTNLY